MPPYSVCVAHLYPFPLVNQSYVLPPTCASVHYAAPLFISAPRVPPPASMHFYPLFSYLKIHSVQADTG